MDSHCRARVLGVAVLVVRSIHTFSATYSITGSTHAFEHCATACGYPSISCRQHQVRFTECLNVGGGFSTHAPLK